jgi:heavy metal translocating P-type ATPase
MPSDRAGRTATTGRDVVLDVEGMTCSSCVERLERVLARQPSVSEARVNLASRSAVVRSTSADPAALIAAVEKAGYRARIHDPLGPAADEMADAWRRLAVSAFCSFDVLAFSLVVAPGSCFSVLAAWLLATPVQFYGGWPFLRAAFRAARNGTYTMDTLVACGSLAAYGYSVGAVLTRGHHAYFETSALIVTLILLGRVLEARVRAKAGDAARLLLKRQPSTATRLEGRTERQVAVVDLRVGNRVVVRPGQQIPADGTVRRGTSSVDLSMLTGESIPADVGPGYEVVGSSLNGHGRLVIGLTRVGQETRLAQIVRLLEETQASKAPIQRLADRISAVFVPRILALAVGVFLVLWFLGSGGVGGALLRAAAVLLVACPCSLGLATPAAVMAGSGRAAEAGILFKGGAVFEAARRIDTVLIDKTGTLTEGSMRLREIVAADPGLGEDEVLALAAAAEEGSEHPIARCVVQAARERSIAVPDAADHRAEPGAGIEAMVRFSRVRVGRPEALPGALAARAEILAACGHTVFAVWLDGRPVGLLSAADSIKEGAAEAVRRLRRWGWDVAVVSGDRMAAVEAVAREAGIERVVAEAFPEGKVEEVRRLQASGRRVAFVGDGINDAPAIAQADLGIALGTGTDVAMEAGHVLIMGGDLGLVAEGLEIARRTFWVIAQNLAWAFAYNSLMIPLAVVGKVSPLVAATVMAGSSVTVVGNALRLRRVGAPGPRRAQTASPVDDRASEGFVDRRAMGAALHDGAMEASALPPDFGAEEAARPVPAAPEGAAASPPPPGGLRAFAREEAKRVLGNMDRLFANQWET